MKKFYSSYYQVWVTYHRHTPKPLYYVRVVKWSRLVFVCVYDDEGQWISSSVTIRSSL